MAAIFFLEFRYMESDWAGLPGFLFTLPLSALVVAIGFIPAIVGRFGYDIGINFTDYHFEYGFIVCALLNAFILYPFYRFRVKRKQAKVFEPPPPNNSFNRTRN
jgi:hypothetical protein